MCYVFRAGRPLQGGRSKEGGSGSLYTVSKLSYCQIWCRMNVLSSDAGTLLHVCKTFEELLITTSPKLFLHLANLGLPPLKVALPWMQLGFTTALDPEEVLLLWDRVFGYMDTVLLAVAAASIFIFKSTALFLCQTEQEAFQQLNDTEALKIIPLLQMFLFRDVRDQ